MSGMQLVVVIAVRNVVDIDLKGQMLCQPMFRHSIENPISRDFLDQSRDWLERCSGAGGAAGNKVSSYACLPAPRETLRTPEVKGVARHVRKLGADCRRIIIGADQSAIQIRVASQHISTAGQMGSYLHLRAIHALCSGQNVQE